MRDYKHSRYRKPQREETWWEAALAFIGLILSVGGFIIIFAMIEALMHG